MTTKRGHNFPGPSVSSTMEINRVTGFAGLNTPVFVAKGTTPSFDAQRETTNPAHFKSPKVKGFRHTEAKGKGNPKGVAIMTSTIGAHREKTPATNSGAQTKGTIPTPIKIETLADLLEGYDCDKKQYLLQGFLYGFNIGFEGPQISNNLKSAFEQHSAVKEKLDYTYTTNYTFTVHYTHSSQTLRP